VRIGFGEDKDMNRHFDIAVIGSGPGGYIAALKAAQLGAKVAIIEKHCLGGTCLNYGCIPSKALLASAELVHKINNAESMGVTVGGTVSFDWSAIQKRKDKIVAKLRGGIKGLFAARKVTLFKGAGQISGPGKIRVTDSDGSVESLTAANTIIATGSVPARIAGWPTDRELVCTSDEALHWDRLPKQLLTVGGGVIGCEFACMMREYGVRVTIVEIMPGLLPEMEPQLGATLAEILKKRGVKILTGVKVEEMNRNGDMIRAAMSDGQSLEFDKVLVATGRRPNTTDSGIETAGVETDNGFVRVNDRMQTSVKGYYCIGDANGRCLLAHAASAQAVVAASNALGHDKEDTLPVPNVVYTFPEIASVGLTTKQAGQKQIPVSVGQFPIGYLGKAMAVGEQTGFVKVVRQRDDGRLLGVHVIGHNATEVIEAATALIGCKASAEDMAQMVFAHPTISEAMKEAAEDAFNMALHLPPRKVVRLTVGGNEE
jgi:dihydrolipoamide dehydrogenase